MSGRRPGTGIVGLRTSKAPILAGTGRRERRARKMRQKKRGRGYTK